MAAPPTNMQRQWIYALSIFFLLQSSTVDAHIVWLLSTQCKLISHSPIYCYAQIGLYIKCQVNMELRNENMINLCINIEICSKNLNRCFFGKIIHSILFGTYPHPSCFHYSPTDQCNPIRTSQFSADNNQPIDESYTSIYSKVSTSSITLTEKLDTSHQLYDRIHIWAEFRFL